jgi:hypothetical protein
MIWLRARGDAVVAVALTRAEAKKVCGDVLFHTRASRRYRRTSEWWFVVVADGTRPHNNDMKLTRSALVRDPRPLPFISLLGRPGRILESSR